MLSVTNTTAAPQAGILPASFPAERLTENILSLSDTAVLLTQRDQMLSWCSQSISTVLGVKREEVLATGWKGIQERVHPDDRKTLEKKLLPALRHQLKKLHAEERNAYVFSYTLRLQHANGAYVLVAFENQPMQWKKADWPSVYMTVIKNITQFGNKQAMILNIAHCGADKLFTTVFHQEFAFPSDVFTFRELEVIRLIARGLTSKRIAEELFISVETVRNHRKNILTKSGCDSAAKVISFADKKGII